VDEGPGVLPLAPREACLNPASSGDIMVAIQLGAVERALWVVAALLAVAALCDFLALLLYWKRGD
jgi:hypothetical protein